MQVVSPAFTAASQSAANKVTYGALISWTKQVNASTSFFTVGTSTIGGPDIIKGADNDTIGYGDRYQYDSETANVGTISIQRQLGVYPWGLVMAQADIQLNNDSQRYLPGKDVVIGDYILPNRPLKLSVGFDSESIRQFVGYTDRPDNAIIERTTEIHAFDLMTYLNGFESQHDPFIDTYAHLIMAELFTEAGLVASQYELETSLQSPIGYLSPKDSKIGDICRDLCEAEQGLLFCDEQGIVRFWNRQHLANHDAPVWDLDYSNMTKLNVTTSQIINDVTVKANPREVAAKQKLWDLATPQRLGPGESVDVFVDFADDDGPLPVTSVDTPVYGANEDVTSIFDVTTDPYQDGRYEPGVAVTSDYLFGTSYRVTFKNSSAYTLYVNKLVIHGTPAKVTDHIEQRHYDQASIDKYGRNPDSDGEPIVIENDYIQDVSTALSAAKILTDNYGEPTRRYTATVFAAPQLQIGDFVTATINDTSDTRTMWIVGSSLNLSTGSITQQLTLEERELINYFTIGASTIGGPDEISP